MKKLISGIMVVALILALATTVNAASLSASATSVAKGETVVVTVNLDQATSNVDVTLKYDATKFEYVEDSAAADIGDLTVNNTTAGVIYVSGAHATKTTNKVSFTFKALENTEAATFTASDLVTGSNEALATPSVSVAVADATQEGTTGGEQEGTTGGSTSTEEEKPTKLPQTGVPYAVIAMGVVAVIAVATIVVRKK